ncbi:hypothetical protein JCM8208_000291, partial [Rhodotorula glutinis]
MSYDGFKSSIAALRVAPAAAPAKEAQATSTRPISPPESDASSVDGVALHNDDKPRYVEDWNGNLQFAPIKEHIVSR